MTPPTTSPRPWRRSPRPWRSRRAAATLVAVVAGVATLVAAGCGGFTEQASPTAARVADEVPVAAAPPATATSSTLPATTTTAGPRPLAPHEVLVAVVRPEITELSAYDAPDGELVRSELPLINPWYFGGELALLVTGGRETDAWVQVSLPVRPNGSSGWIRTSDVTFRSHRFHVTVSVGERVLRAYEGDALLLETPVVVGRPSTPTPLGNFYINANIPQANRAGAYGPVILGVSSFSEVLDTFDGGLAAIGIHGTNQPSLVGQAASNGCIRVPNDAIVRLAELVPVGTPVDFVA